MCRSLHKPTLALPGRTGRTRGILRWRRRLGFSGVPRRVCRAWTTSCLARTGLGRTGLGRTGLVRVGLGRVELLR